MSRSNHPIEHEELMAYLDGELATDRAVAAAAHLERCAECQELAAELRKMSQELMAWEIEESGLTELPEKVTAALEKSRNEPKKRPRKKQVVPLPAWTEFFFRRWKLVSGLAVMGIVAALVVVPNLLRSRAGLVGFYEPMAESRKPSPSVSTPSSSPVGASDGTLNKNGTTYAYDSLGNLASPKPERGYVGGLAKEEERGQDETASSEHTIPNVPMIARTAGLTLTTKEFDKTRAALDEILKLYHGYLGDLKVSAPAEAGRSLTATLRIPAPQLDAAMAELKKLGRVENEAQGGEEVTQQYVDLEARLKNSQHTEQRLVQMLAQRTGKLQDVLKVELEIDRVRGEIEQMQAEKKELSKRVAFATLSTIINEEYHAKLQGAPPSTGSRFRNAAVEGYNTVVEGLIDVGLFLFSAGPSLLLWAAILFFPARWAWKKIREKSRQAETSSAD
jgi:uncharacterized protein DUF4349/putative zinc finger protein